MLRHWREHHIRNPVVLTGDIHSHWANELLTDFDRPDSPPVGVEFVGTSISSGGDGTAAPRTLAATQFEGAVRNEQTDDCSQQSCSPMKGVNLGDEHGAIAGDRLGGDDVR